MNKITRVLGATLGATAIVGSSAVAATAHEGGSSHHGAYSVRGAHHEFSQFTRHHGDDRGEDNASFGVGRDFNHRWFHQHWAGHHHRQLTFEQKQAAIVDRLTKADTRLSTLIARISQVAQDNPDSWAAQALPYLQQQQTKLETLIAAVKAATNQQELADAFKAAFAPPAPPTSAPTDGTSTTPTPSPTTTPTAPTTSASASPTA